MSGHVMSCHVGMAHERRAGAGMSRDPWWRAVLRLPSRLLLLLIHGYQRYISPMTPATCRFYPSCSQYAVIAVQRHGAIRGTGLAVWRVLRCHPWNPGGVDDVPEVGSLRGMHRHGAEPTPARTSGPGPDSSVAASMAETVRGELGRPGSY